ncbi:MAG: glycosyltransferase family A protein [Caldilineaceae bacterium]
MSNLTPLVSVVIPSRNAPASLTATLAALAQQTMAADCYEVIVVGGVEEEVTRQRVPAGLPYALRVHVKRGPGASRRRNAGAELALADLLVFLDDDMEPEPQLLDAHYRAHAGGSGRRVVMGYLPPDADLRADLRAGRRRIDWLKVQLSDWWEEGFAAMAEPGHRFAYTDVLSGNFSLRAALFHEAGGFDPDYYPCRDDFEFGVRLLQVGAELAFSREARSRHDDKTDLPRLLQRKRDEGRTDVQLARQYPHIRPALLITRQLHGLNWPSVLLRRVARTWPAAAGLIASMAVPMLHMCERLTMRATWPKVIAGLLVHAYWQGVLGATRDWDEVFALTTAPAPSLGTVDLALGIDCVGEVLDRNPVQGVCLTWRGLPLGRIEPQAGAEPAAKRHVEAWLRAGGAQTVMRAQTLDRWLGTEGNPATWWDVPIMAAGGEMVKPAVPTVVWELDLSQGMSSLQPLTSKFGQAVFVRKAGETLGWLYLEEREQPRLLGEVIYALFVQLDPSAFTIEW